MTNIKSHNGFPLTPRSMILDVLEPRSNTLCILLKFRDISRVSGAITAKGIKIDSATENCICSPLNALSSDLLVYITLISHGVPPLWGVKQGRGG